MTVTVEAGYPPFLDDATNRTVAGCASPDANVDWFFPPEGTSRAERKVLDSLAKRVCRACPFQAECNAWALATAQRHGTWGSTTEQERRCLLNQCNHVQCRNRKDAP